MQAFKAKNCWRCLQVSAGEKKNKKSVLTDWVLKETFCSVAQLDASCCNSVKSPHSSRMSCTLLPLWASAGRRNVKGRAWRAQCQHKRAAVVAVGKVQCMVNKINFCHSLFTFGPRHRLRGGDSWRGWPQETLLTKTLHFSESSRTLIGEDVVNIWYHGRIKLIADSEGDGCVLPVADFFAAFQASSKHCY